jgi:hypothetical protein
MHLFFANPLFLWKMVSVDITSLLIFYFLLSNIFLLLSDNVEFVFSSLFPCFLLVECVVLLFLVLNGGERNSRWNKKAARAALSAFQC